VGGLGVKGRSWEGRSLRLCTARASVGEVG
jgi:hypothetical protein